MDKTGQALFVLLSSATAWGSSQFTGQCQSLDLKRMCWINIFHCKNNSNWVEKELQLIKVQLIKVHRANVGSFEDLELK